MKSQTDRRRRPWAAILACVALLAAAVAGCSGRSHYGDPFTAAPVVGISVLMAEPESFRRQPLRINGRIERQCPASGCWFVLADETGGQVRVELGDSHSRLPKRVGRRASVEGELIRMGESHVFIGTRVAFE